MPNELWSIWTCFCLLDYVSRRSEKVEFQKKEMLKLFIFGVTRNHQENKYFETSLSFGELCKYCDKHHVFSFNRRSGKFQLM